MESEKSQKSASTTTGEEHEPNHLLVPHLLPFSLKREEQIQHCVADDDDGRNTFATPQNQQNLPILQPTMDQPSTVLRPCVPNLSPPSVADTQWPQLPNKQFVQPGFLQPQLAQSTTPIWPPQMQFVGYQLPGVNTPAMFQLGTVDTSCQVPTVMPGGTSSNGHPQVPNLCFGYPYPGFPGPWDPSQVQQLWPFSAYTFPGGSNQFHLQPVKVPSSSESNAKSSQRGIIRVPEKLSQKHKQVWEAQSAENGQLWAVIGQLQSEIADYKSHVLKLEEEVSSLKQVVEKPTGHAIGAAVSGQARRRGRPPKRATASPDALPSHEESQPRARGRKPAQYKAQIDDKAHIFEKVILNKVENKGTPCNPTVINQQQSENNIEVIDRNLMLHSFNSRDSQETPQIQICGGDLNYSYKVKIHGSKTESSNINFGVVPQLANGITDRGALAALLGTRNNESLGGPSTITAQDGGFNMSSQGCLYHDGSVIRENGKVIPGWSFVKQEDVSEELEAAVVASANGENELEMEDNSSSDGAGIAGTASVQ